MLESAEPSSMILSLTEKLTTKLTSSKLYSFNFEMHISGFSVYDVVLLKPEISLEPQLKGGLRGLDMQLASGMTSKIQIHDTFFDVGISR